MIYSSAALFTFSIYLTSIGLVNGQILSTYYPTVTGQLIEHRYYTLDYNEATEQANWVIYAIHPFGSQKRKDNFKSDPLVSTGSATVSDYSKSGYDRGHLASAADMNSTSVSMDESFYMSNMSPQLPGFNRGIWKKLESLMRNWAIEYNSPEDYIVVGPVFNEEQCGTIGSGVQIPCYFYRIYLNLNRGEAIGFILPNESSSDSLKHFAVPIDSIEAVTGIDFFPSLNDELENRVESYLNIENWSWSGKPKMSRKPYNEADSVQCYAILKSSEQRCELKTINENMYCRMHQEPSTQLPVLDTDSIPQTKGSSTCKAFTKEGSPCKRKASESNGYCWQHSH